jgi:hypothetical protein
VVVVRVAVLLDETAADETAVRFRFFSGMDVSLAVVVVVLLVAEWSSSFSFITSRFMISVACARYTQANAAADDWAAGDERAAADERTAERASEADKRAVAAVVEVLLAAVVEVLMVAVAAVVEVLLAAVVEVLMVTAVMAERHSGRGGGTADLAAAPRASRRSRERSASYRSLDPPDLFHACHSNPVRTEHVKGG